jgi:hypothetical protein
VLLQAASQQIWFPLGPTQLPLKHWLLCAHAVPSGLSWHWCTAIGQYELMQSAGMRQPWFNWHVFPRESQSGPPQSTSVS